MTGPKVIIHNEHGGDFSATRWFFDNLRDKTTFTKWDIIGVSFYPWWHGELTDLEDNLKRMRTEYGKDLAVVEFAYAWTEDEKDDGIENIYVDPPHPGYNYTEQGQVEYIRALLDVVDSVPGAFMGCYWAPGTFGKTCFHNADGLWYFIISRLLRCRMDLRALLSLCLGEPRVI